MLEHLFGSKTRLKLLKLFFRDTQKAYYVREITRLIDAQINAVRRELELLIKAGLVKELDKVEEDLSKNSTKKKAAGAGLRKYYTLEIESILYPEMEALLIKAQTLGEQKFVDEIKTKAGDLSLFLLTGRFTGDKRAPSDMLLVGDVKERTLDRLVKKYEKDLGIEIMYTVMTTSEFEDRRHVMDKFIFSLFEGRNVKVVDKVNL